MKRRYRIAIYIVASFLCVFLTVLIVSAIVRLVHHHEYREPMKQDNMAMVDVALLPSDNPLTRWHAYDLSRVQNWKCGMGMTVLVAQGLETDGIYLIDVQGDLLRMDHLQDKTYHVVSGKHSGRTWHHVHGSNEQQRDVHVMTLQEDSVVDLPPRLGWAFIDVAPGVHQLTLQVHDLHALVHVLNRNTTDLEVKLWWQQESFKLNPGWNSVIVVGNALYKTPTVPLQPCGMSAPPLIKAGGETAL